MLIEVCIECTFLTQSALDFPCWCQASQLKTLLTSIFSFALWLGPDRCRSPDVSHHEALQPSALTPLTLSLTLSPRSPPLTGEASHLD